MKKQSSTGVKIATPKKKRPGVHSKKGSSKNKGSKLYKKVYRAQGH